MLLQPHGLQLTRHTFRTFAYAVPSAWVCSDPNTQRGSLLQGLQVTFEVSLRLHCLFLPLFFPSSLTVLDTYLLIY